jgi:hypothetical protein
MTTLSARIGRIAAWAETTVGYLYLPGYLALLVVFPIRPWTHVLALAAGPNAPHLASLAALQALAFLQALLVLMLAIVICRRHECS